MRFNKQTNLSGELAKMEICELQRLLQDEIGKELRDIDEGRVRQILQELETRPCAESFADDDAIRAACDRYRTEHEEDTPTPAAPKRNRLIRVVAVAAVLALIITVLPMARGERNLFDLVRTINEDVVAFFNPNQSGNQLDHEYQTDHPGLQRLYDAIAALGIAEDVVPAWIPDDYVLVELETQTFPAKTRVWACFEDGDNSLLFFYDLYGMAVTYEYVKDGTAYEKYERAGVTHEIYTNNETQTVLWEHDNLKCSIVADCQEDQLTEILDAIYRWRTNN